MMPPIRQDYRYSYNCRRDIRELTAALASRLGATLESVLEEDVHVERLFLVLLEIYRDWWSKRTADPELQALFSVAAASSWLAWDAGRARDLSEMLDEVAAECKRSHETVARRSHQEFTTIFSAPGLAKAVERSFGANVYLIVLTPDFFEVRFSRPKKGEEAAVESGILYMQRSQGLYLVDSTNSIRWDYRSLMPPLSDDQLLSALSTSKDWSPTLTKTSAMDWIRKSGGGNGTTSAGSTEHMRPPRRVPYGLGRSAGRRQRRSAAV